MNQEIAQSLKNYLDDKQQKAKVVEIYDFEKAKVKYSEEIKSHREINKFGSEEMVRAYILAKLVNELDYEPKNIELEKEYHIGTPKTTKPRIDIIVRDDNGDAYLLASQEKGQGKKVKYLVLYSIDAIEDTIKDEAYGEAQKEPYVKGGKRDLEKQISSSKLNEDESETESGKEYVFQTKKAESNEQLFERINNLYKKALNKRLNLTDQKKLKKSFVVDENKRNSESKDILGLQLDKLAIEKVNNEQELPYLIDPAAGSGTFLIEYMKFITENLKIRFKDKLSDTEDIKNKHSEWFSDNRENN
ncbi:16638_t:CDS:2 [Funneliformis geosporum]|uniref:16638_t:CDS:1 n=1 Tax=Funneliformis geosporum TaxID=1117311 RepID=A0A9W4SB55_9GLOM|nr:16638_t:CDS:2 [Funneliformis geosporum]